MAEERSIEKSVHRVLRDVTRPARYAGGELNIIRKEHHRRTTVCLAFPDVYDIGQSYIGFHILYHVLNGRDDIACERTFAPWPDMEQVMREHGLPLWSLESFTPLGRFDVVGFTLQYELHYTTVLNMLDLAGIPLDAADRTADHPLVVGGGTCAVNPEPMAQYFDAFLIGDGEEAFPEMLDAIAAAKAEYLAKPDILKRLATIDGVYVPSLYLPITGPDGAFLGMQAAEGASPMVHSRVVTELKREYYPEKPLVPLAEVVHDRLAVEIMRGCPHGCRFCGAGMTYRPFRARPAEDILAQIKAAVDNTGFEDISFVSLSTTDYPGIDTLVSRVSAALAGRGVSLSLSSLRADTFSLSLARAASGGRKPTLTFALEAGTQRLRDVINKQLTEEQLFQTMVIALETGFSRIKLYLMVGLPTETDEDVEATIELLNRLGRRMRDFPGARLNVTVAPFSPKPHTPFQWEAQEPAAALEEKLARIRGGLRSRNVQISRTDPNLAMLEGRLGRGGRDLAPLIRSAWERGSRLDGWSEHFNWDLWRGVFADHGVDLAAGEPARDPGRPLPWSHIHTGVDPSFLLAERDRAVRNETTPECRERCSACGPWAPFCAAADRMRSHANPSPEPSSRALRDGRFGRRPKPVAARASAVPVPGTRLRVKYIKDGAIVFTSHRDLIRIFDRTLRRAGIPVAYSQGFHPHPKFSFGEPLPLGFSSRAEYIDISLSSPFPAFHDVLRRHMPPGLEVVAVQSIPEKAESLVSTVTSIEYFVRTPVTPELAATVERITVADRIEVERTTKKGSRTVDIRPGIRDLRPAKGGDGIVILLSLDPETAVKPSEALALVFGDNVPDDVTRVEQYAIMDDRRVTPMELYGIYR